MAVVFQSTSTAQSGAASVNVSWPIGHITDDIGILVQESFPGTWSVPSGWTLVASSSATGATQLRILWKRATSNAEPAVATGIGTGADHVVARMFTFRGCVTTGSLILTSATSTKTVASTSWSAPSITTTTANEFVIYGVSRDDDSASSLAFSAPTNANLVSPTEAGEAGTISGNGGGFVLGYGVKATAGATGTTTGTVTSSANASITFSLAAITAHVVTAEKGSFTTTGNAATLTRTTSGTALVAETGTFTETGKDAVLARQITLLAEAGGFSETGNAATLKRTAILPSSTGAFTETGNTAVLKTSRLLNAATVFYTLTGRVASLVVNRVATATSGVFVLTGNPSTLEVRENPNKVVLGEKGTFVLSESDIRLIKTRRRIITF
jgi:hypothetical protein